MTFLDTGMEYKESAFIELIIDGININLGNDIRVNNELICDYKQKDINKLLLKLK